ncbi:hypothetical protein M3Y94_00319000 [Aphelenchoides besseyi]|nr:hypothetical protein M3Y94_00319000 [Aphelenchoides besseyi]KAI6235659.1 hypothetical protein M3Y95_00075000 [Aphelenchoides besseyi]
MRSPSLSMISTGSLVLLAILLVMYGTELTTASPLSSSDQTGSENDSIFNNAAIRERRSLANGRWGLRPGKRSVGESDDQAPALNELSRVVAVELNKRFAKRSVATGRWGLRPGKRSVPIDASGSDLYLLVPTAYEQ